jgi:hypothetical protein
MRKYGLLGCIVAACLGLSFMVTGETADAKPKGKAKAEKAEKVEAGKLTIAPSLTPKGLKFGADPKAVYQVYDTQIEKDFLKRYKEVEPGIQMNRLDHEKSVMKDTFRLSYQSFESPPSSLDGTKLTTEFTYGNDEGMMKIKRKGKQRYLFFIKKKLWNVIDVYPLKEGGHWGSDFKSAVDKLEKRLKVPGKAVKPNPEAGQPYGMVMWDDGKMWLRAMDWDNQMAVSYSDLDTVKRLGDLRKHQQEVAPEIDPSVKGVLRNNAGDAPKDDPKGKKK